MYFPQMSNMQPNNNMYQQQLQPTIFPQNMMFPSGNMQPTNPFMYPTKLQPYNDRQFLCKTFNFRVPYIQAFLTLSHEQKLKFFLICQSRRLTGELNDKQTYSGILEKIMRIVNPSYQNNKQNQVHYEPISQQQLKKKIIQKQFEQKCDWQLRKLGMGEQNNYVKQNNYINNSINNNNYSIRSNGNNNDGGLKFDFDQFDIVNNNKKQIKKQQLNQFNTQNVKNTLNLRYNVQQDNDDDQFVFQDNITVPQSSLYSTQLYSLSNNINNQNINNNNNNNINDNINSYNINNSNNINTLQQPTIQTYSSDQVHIQPSKNIINTNNLQQQEQWQQAQQIPQNQYISSQTTSIVQNQNKLIIQYQVPQLIQQKIESIWDMQINEDELKKNQPDIRQIFGMKKNQQDQFGGFQQANNNNQQIFSTNNSFQISNFIHNQNNNQNQNYKQSNNDWMYAGVNKVNQNQYYDQINNYQQHNDKIQQNFLIPNINHYKQTNLTNQIIKNQLFTQSNKQLSLQQQQIRRQNSVFDINSFDVNSFIANQNIQLQQINTLNNFNGNINNTINNEVVTNNKVSSEPIFQFDSLTFATIRNEANEINYKSSQYVIESNIKDKYQNNDIDNDMNQFKNRQQNIADNNKQQQDEWQEGQQVNNQLKQQNNNQQSHNQYQIKQTNNNNIQLSINQKNTQQILNNQSIINTQINHQFTFDSNQINHKNSFDINQIKHGNSFDINQTNYGNSYFNSLNNQINNDLLISIDPFSTIQHKPEQSNIHINQNNIQFPANTITQNNQKSYHQNNSFNFNSLSQKSSSLPYINQPSPPLSQSQTKPIKKIMKPPSMKNIQIQNSHFNKFQNITKTKSTQNNIQSKQLYSKFQTQPYNTDLSSNNNNIQNNITNAFSKRNKLQNISLNLSIVPSINIAVTSSTNLPYPQMSNSQSMSASSYIPRQNTSSYIPQQSHPIKQLKKPTKIISTYNKQITYTPDSFRTSIKTMFNKSKIFFKPITKLNKNKSQIQSSQQPNIGIEQHSMIDMQYGRKQGFSNNNKLNALYSPKASLKRQQNIKNQQLDYSIQVGMNYQSMGDYQFKSNMKGCQDDFGDNVDPLDQGYQQSNQYKNIKNNYNINQNIKSQFNFSKKPVDFNLNNKNKQQKQEQEQKRQIIYHLSKNFIFKLPQHEIKYVDDELKKNKFFFDKSFYSKLHKLIQKLSLTQDLQHFSKSLQRLSPNISSQIPQNSILFQTQLKFISNIVQKLNKIQDLNNKFTIAMQDDQQQQLAQVILRSKQLTFEVNEDGQVAKKIATLVLDGRCCEVDQNEFDEQNDKYKGLYYLIVKLIIIKSSGQISNLPQDNLTQLKAIYSQSWSSTLSSKSSFLYLSTILYLLHIQLDQLQYIKNISKTIFTFLIKQHTILINKINSIKQMSIKYAQPPQSIFTKLMQSNKMTQYLQGLGQMANVAQRLCELIKKIGIKLDGEQFTYQKLTKTITQSRQLAFKYNLLNNQTDIASQTIYTPYLSLILNMISSNKCSQQIYLQMRNMLKQKPLCKVCLIPRKQNNLQEGDFIANAVVVSQQSLGSRDSVEWCHFTCYNMLKMAFQDINQNNID